MARSDHDCVSSFRDLYAALLSRQELLFRDTDATRLAALVALGIEGRADAVASAVVGASRELKSHLPWYTALESPVRLGLA